MSSHRIDALRLPLAFIFFNRNQFANRDQDHRDFLICLLCVRQLVGFLIPPVSQLLTLLLPGLYLHWEEAFDKFSSEMQARLPEHLPDDYAKTQLLSMAMERPELEAAWLFNS